ncbi:beta-lactamase superfamily domain-containing protein [Apodospora peruviana]|uniref:Beta-lactamase superfamily domain-containing protein n=1 Tax=Apodospora peruviana TaxID=516989 RepID=A0AAE0I1Q4_9PEZI|nr:beta-lactamase superfamily domain-containing protein [Apodospora peruviana]
MSTDEKPRLALERVERSRDIPKHHVAAPASKGMAASFFTFVTPGTPAKPYPNNSAASFRNPWPSWHSPTRAEVWEHLSWGEDQDQCIQLATSHLSDVPASPTPPEKAQRPQFGDITNWPDSNGAKAARLLSIEKPDFSFNQPGDPRAKVTWLGHASMLVQFPPLDQDKPGVQPVRCLFDPMFSMRCSPSQNAGPIRSYPPPCQVDDLPPIDAVFISHNHFDHLDYDTIQAIWKSNVDTVRFFVPLRNAEWFMTSCGIPETNVTEMDWWDCAHLAAPSSTVSGAVPRMMKIWCTPAQHNSGRSGPSDANCTLWSSWYIEYRDPRRDSYRLFFAGDTGYQFHSSPAWPPSPNRPYDDQADDGKFPACPAFAEIRDKLGQPDLLLMPISVGSTFSYLRSFVPLPDWISPFPRHSMGLTAANHMPPWDAVRVVKLMTEQSRDGSKEAVRRPQEKQTLAIAMHWGTFVTDPLEVMKTLGQLEWACKQQGLRFARLLPSSEQPRDGVNEKGPDLAKDEEAPCFLALNHGQSIYC